MVTKYVHNLDIRSYATGFEEISDTIFQVQSDLAVIATLTLPTDSFYMWLRTTTAIVFSFDEDPIIPTTNVWAQEGSNLLNPGEVVGVNYTSKTDLRVLAASEVGLVYASFFRR